MSDLQDLTPIAHLFDLVIVVCDIYNDGVTVVTLEVVGHDGKGAFSILRQGHQVGKELYNALVAFKNLRWSHIRLGLGHHQVGKMATLVVRALNIKKHTYFVRILLILVLLLAMVLFTHFDEASVFCHQACSHSCTNGGGSLSILTGPCAFMAPATPVTDAPMLR